MSYLGEAAFSDLVTLDRPLLVMENLGLLGHIRLAFMAVL